MITVLNQPMTVRRYRRCERFLHQRDFGPLSVVASVERRAGQRLAYLEVHGNDEAGVRVDVRVECRDLRDAEVMVLAALERRGLKTWADRLMGGAV